MAKVLSDYELGWLVGILEGEGTFEYTNVYNGRGSQAIAVKMTDEDVVNTVALLFERLTGSELNVREIPRPRDNWSPTFEIKVYGENARIIMRTVVKSMSYRRRQKIWQSLNEFRITKNQMKPLKLISGA